MRPETIYENWYCGEGHCAGCPRRDEKRVASPPFGYGTYPADVALVGEAPGGNETGEDNDLDTDKRIWKNADELPTEAGDLSPAEAEDFHVAPLSEMPEGTRKNLEKYFDAFRRRWPKSSDEVEIYFTNHTKCNDIHESKITGMSSERASSLNEGGKDECEEYLVPELEECDPDAVLVFSKGGEHLRRVLRTLEVGEDLSPDVSKLVFGTDPETRETPLRLYSSDALDGTPVAASVHFRGGFRHLGGEFDDDLQRDDLGDPDRDHQNLKDRFADEVAMQLAASLENA